MRRTATEIAKLNYDALELRRAGIPVPRIREQLGFRSREATEKAIASAMAAAPAVADPHVIRQLELDRLDRLHAGVWAKAVKGDVSAIDRVMRLSEMRIKLAGIPSDQMVMLAAYDETVTALHLDEVSNAAIAAGRRIAEQIDTATATGDALQVTKALYLVPHLMNVLDKLGATPMSLRVVETVAREVTDTPPENDLEAFKRRQNIT